VSNYNEFDLQNMSVGEIIKYYVPDKQTKLVKPSKKQDLV